MTIPEEAIEKAAEAVWDDHLRILRDPVFRDAAASVEYEDDVDCARAIARAALEAAAPLLMAGALREAARDLSWLMAQGNLVEPDTASAGIRACMDALNRIADEKETP